jgi:hypothetical protein
MTRTTIVIAAGLALAVTLPAVPAQALAARTFVSGAGNDANPCTLSQPCRSFQAAYNVTAANGEIDVLDPAGYGERANCRQPLFGDCSFTAQFQADRLLSCDHRLAYLARQGRHCVTLAAGTVPVQCGHIGG